MYFVVQKREIEDIYICSADDNRVLYRATICFYSLHCMVESVHVCTLMHMYFISLNRSWFHLEAENYSCIL